MISMLQIFAITINHPSIPNRMWNVPIIELVYLKLSITKYLVKIVSEDLKLVKFVVTSRYWRS